MTEPTGPPDAAPTPPDGVSRYELLCLVTLLLMTTVLVGRGFGLPSLVPLLVGGLGVLGRWRLALPLLVLMLMLVLLDLWRFLGFGADVFDFDPLGDFLLCAAVLGYASAQYRLQGLARSLLPDDPRDRRKPAEKKEEQRTRPLLDAEIPMLLMSLPFWAWLAALLWEELPPDWRDLGLPPRYRRLIEAAELSKPVWRLLVIVAGLGAGAVLWAGLTTLLNRGRRGPSPEEAVMYLQDVLWRETRSEQTRIQRWLTWARLRHERRQGRKRLP
jgi:hypothetical protein